MYWFWRILQLSIIMGVLSANIYWGWTDNGYTASAWAFMAAFAVTTFPYTVYDWWITRNVRREENARKRALGIPYGWRRHLPWNSGPSRRVRRSSKVGSDSRIV